MANVVAWVCVAVARGGGGLNRAPGVVHHRGPCTHANTAFLLLPPTLAVMILMVDLVTPNFMSDLRHLHDFYLVTACSGI